MTRPQTAPDWATNANYGAGPYPGFANKQQPSAGKIAEGFDPADYLPAEWLNWIFNNHAAWITYLDSIAGWWLFGDGSDGAVTLDGTAAAPSGMTKAGSTYTLTRDFFATNLTVTGASTKLVTAGFRLYCNGTLTCASGAAIANDGSTAVGGNVTTAGNGAPQGSLGAGRNGGTGGAINTVGSAGTNATASYGGAGGAGGAGSGGSGAGGTSTAPTASTSRPNALGGMFDGLGIDANTLGNVLFQGGAGGGGGGGSITNTGTGGGGGGGVMIIFARLIVLNSTGDIHVAGGGGGGTNLDSGCGGGGGGGLLILVYASAVLASGAAPAFSAATNCPGGAGGMSLGGGSNGTTGSNGQLFSHVLSSGLPAAVAHVEEGNITVTGGATASASFTTPFSAAPPNPSGYKFRWDIAVTDGGPAPTIRLTSLTTTGMTWTIDSDNFNGVISWRATA